MYHACAAPFNECVNVNVAPMHKSTNVNVAPILGTHAQPTSQINKCGSVYVAPMWKCVRGTHVAPMHGERGTHEQVWKCVRGTHEGHPWHPWAPMQFNTCERGTHVR